MFYTTNWWATKMWFYSWIYKETLISNRRTDSSWWIDLGSNNCSGSYSEIAVYRVNDDHWCWVWVCHTPNFSTPWYGIIAWDAHYQNGPTPSYPIAKWTNTYRSTASNEPVWIMVR